MKNAFRLLAVLLFIGASGFLMAGACDEVADAAGEPCGPCGSLKNGDVTITGSAQVDGVLKAIGTLDMTAGSIQADFDAKVRAMAEGVFGIDVTRFSCYLIAWPMSYSRLGSAADNRTVSMTTDNERAVPILRYPNPVGCISQNSGFVERQGYTAFALGAGAAGQH